MKPEKILEHITIIPLYAAAVLLPLFFLPITNEWLEWNKHYLLAILVVISLLAWLGRGLITKKLTITRSPLDIPIVIWWILVLVSAILAKDRVVGFFGPADNVSWGFLALTFYALAAFLVIWNLRKEQLLTRFIDFLGIGIGLSSLYFWLGRFGLLDWLTGPKWNPATSLNTHFGILLVLLLVLALGILMIPIKIPRWRAVLWGVLAGLSLITIAALGFFKIWLAAAIGLFLLLVLTFPRLGEVRYPIVSLAMVVFVISLVFLILGTPQFLTMQTSAEITLAPTRSLQISVDTLKEGIVRTLFGSGPGTFIYDFSAHRPENFNLNALWSMRFSRPGASSYQLLSETGVLGSLAALVVFLIGIGTILQMWLKKTGGRLRNRIKSVVTGSGENAELHGLFTAFAAVWLCSMVMLFFIAYSTVLWFLFFVSLAILVVLGQMLGLVPSKELVLSFKTTPQYALATSFVYIVVVVAVVIGGIFLGRFYGAEVLATQAVRAATIRNFEDAENTLRKAVNLNPYRAKYQLNRASVFLTHAAIESRKAQPDNQKIGALVGNAINASRRATALAPLSVVSWEQLSKMYANARPFAAEANSWVVATLTQAITLEPTNPRLYARRGLSYRLDPERAVEAKADFEKATELKANYAPAHYQLSRMYEAEGDVDAAITSAARAAQIASRDTEAQFNLARLLYNRNQGNDWDGAEQLYRNILRLNPDHANTLYALGILLERKGDYGPARDAYERALELDPDSELVIERLENLPEGTPRTVEAGPVEEEEVEEEEAETGEAAVE